MTATESKPKLVPLAAPIRDAMTCYSWAFQDDLEWLNQGVRFYKAAEPARRPGLVIQMADACSLPRRVLTALMEYQAFDRIPTCDECGAEAYLYEPLVVSGGLTRHTFHCRACALQDRKPAQWD